MEEFSCPTPFCYDKDADDKKIPRKLVRVEGGSIGRFTEVFTCDDHGIFVLCDCCPEVEHLAHITLQGTDEEEENELVLSCELGKEESLGVFNMQEAMTDMLMSEGGSQ